jgi:hypothetical protein
MSLIYEKKRNKRSLKKRSKVALMRKRQGKMISIHTNKENVTPSVPK